MHVPTQIAVLCGFAGFWSTEKPRDVRMFAFVTHIFGMIKDKNAVKMAYTKQAAKGHRTAFTKENHLARRVDRRAYLFSVQLSSPLLPYHPRGDLSHLPLWFQSRIPSVAAWLERLQNSYPKEASLFSRCVSTGGNADMSEWQYRYGETMRSILRGLLRGYARQGNARWATGYGVQRALRQ